MKPRTTKRAALDDAERKALDVLRLTVTGCEYCRRDVATEPHHVASGGNKAANVGDVRLIALLCRDCHDVIEGMRGVDERACGLALLYHAGRMDLEHYYRVTARRWPDASVVELWIRRLTNPRS